MASTLLQELDVDLDLLARHLLLVALGVDLADPRSARQPAQPIALENAIASACSRTRSLCSASRLNLCIAIILSALPGFNQRMTRKSVYSYMLHALGKLAL
jgi:hypothetical protein